MEISTLTTINGMDSRDIAEQTGKNHADVCRDVRKMIEDLGGDESKFASVYKGGNGEDRRCCGLSISIAPALSALTKMKREWIQSTPPAGSNP